MDKKILFKQESIVSSILDPRAGFKHISTRCEDRQNPLTGDSSRIAHFGSFKIPTPDLKELGAEKFKTKCPFCPENIDEVTPVFPSELLPEGRLKLGVSTVIPNISPYDRFSAVTVMTKEHLMLLPDWTGEKLTGAFQAAAEFCRLTRSAHPEEKYYLISWNYMPPSGGSQVHPHLQVFIGSHGANLYRRELEASENYYMDTGRTFWQDYLEEEQKLSRRYLGSTGKIHWLSSFAPMGLLGDIEAVIPENKSLWELSSDFWSDLSEGLLKVFSYFHAQNIFSFNLALFPQLEEQHFRTHLRIIPRVSVNPRLGVPDSNVFHMLYQQPICLLWPEEAAKVISTYFD